jgi:hypothetical protein
MPYVRALAGYLVNFIPATKVTLNKSIESGLARWRLTAAFLVVLALVLPVSQCTREGAQTIEYHYIIADALDDRPKPNLTHDELVRANRRDLLLSIAAFCWPLFTSLLALRQEWRLFAILRRMLEPILILASAWWLQVVVLFHSPAIGYYVVTLGLILYGLVWALECVQYLRAAYHRQ